MGRRHSSVTPGRHGNHKRTGREHTEGAEEGGERENIKRERERGRQNKERQRGREYEERGGKRREGDRENIKRERGRENINRGETEGGGERDEEEVESLELFIRRQENSLNVDEEQCRQEVDLVWRH